MRIAFLGDPNNQHTRRWASYFANRGHVCAVFCDPPVLRPLQGVEIICPRMSLARKAVAFKFVRHRFSNDLFKAGPYRSAVGHWKPDLVHGFEALNYGYATAACRRRPTVLTPWGNDIFDWPRQSKLARYLVTRALRGAWMISTNAPGLEIFLAHEYGIAPQKVDCFSWGVDLSVFRPGLTEEAKAFGKQIALPEDARVVLSPRMMKPYWGVGLIAEALGAIARPPRRAGPPVVVVFLRGFGSAAYEEELRRRIVSEGLAPHARFVSQPLTASEMAAAFNRAEVFISAPQTDLLASTVLEGMACGCVPILADLPYYHARVQDGENGFFLAERTPATIAAAVQQALAWPQRLQEMGRANVEQAARLDDWRRCAPRMEALYQRVAGKKD